MEGSFLVHWCAHRDDRCNKSIWNWVATVYPLCGQTSPWWALATWERCWPWPPWNSYQVSGAQHVGHHIPTVGFVEATSHGKGAFFWAHAVLARGSDGHQNVLYLIRYSHVLENRWKQKPGVSQANNKTQKKNNQKQTKRTPGDTRRTRWDTTLSEK